MTLLVTVALIWLVGILLKAISDRCLFYLFGYRLTLTFSFPGVVCHELAHLIMCLLFRHKVTAVNFFRPGHRSLGFVTHSYQPSSFWQNAGNLFISLAPIILGPVFLIMLAYLLIPDPAFLVRLVMGKIDQFIPPDASFPSFYAEYLFDNLAFNWLESPVKTSLWFMAAGSVALHSMPSTQDLKNAVRGLLGGVILLCITGAVLVVAQPIFSASFSFESWLQISHRLYFVILFFSAAWCVTSIAVSTFAAVILKFFKQLIWRPVALQMRTVWKK